MSGASEFDVRLAALQERFRIRAREDCGRLAELLAKVEERGDARPETLDALRTIAHRLAGAGGTFGFPAVSIAAETLEKELLAAVPDHDSIRRDGRELLDVLDAL